MIHWNQQITVKSYIKTENLAFFCFYSRLEFNPETTALHKLKCLLDSQWIAKVILCSTMSPINYIPVQQNS